MTTKYDLREARFGDLNNEEPTADKLTKLTHEIEKKEKFRAKTFSGILLFAIISGLFIWILGWDAARTEAFAQLLTWGTVITLTVQTLGIHGLRKDRDNLSARLLGEAGSRKGY